MIKNVYSLIVFFVTVSLLTSVNVSASDLAKEKRWAGQVVEAILDGEAVWLNDGRSDFLSIYTEAGSDVTQVAIVMHGTGVHPDWQQVVYPLRVGLAEQGWNTLSIQMPILENEASHEDYAKLYDEVAPRIDAAIAYLRNLGNKEIALVAHSQGAAMASYYLRDTKQKIKGLVAIGMSGEEKDDRMNGSLSLQRITLPVLDLYGTQDLDSVLSSTDKRAAAAKSANNKDYKQLQIEGNHFFDGHNDDLIEAVLSWLDALK